MKTLYIDCSNGISGDMLRRVLQELAEAVTVEAFEEPYSGEKTEEDGHSHDGHHHHRSLQDVRAIIDKSGKSEAARKVALRIYDAIAAAEAAVHGGSLESVHFHEVGRDGAIANALGIGRALDLLGLVTEGRIVVSDICDGRGFVDCAHGRIPVPVPAVQAMMEECGRKYPAFIFKTCPDVDTEMVTPSGLAGLIGIGAVPAGEGMMFMEGTITAAAEAEGTRNTGRGGLRAYLIEK